jgi:hypothetical protein
VRCLASIIIAVFVTGCGRGAEEPSATLGRPGFSVVDRVPTDTASEWTVSHTLVLVLRDTAGRPASGVEVFFIAPDDPNKISLRKHAAPLGPTEPVDTTDTSGRVEVLVLFGQHAGTARVIASAPRASRRDTISVTVRSGAPAAVQAWPQDTAVYSGGTLEARGLVIDRFGNTRPDSAFVAATSVGLTATGRTLTARDIPGREWALMRFGAFTDTAWVSVVPRGEMVTRTLKLTDPDYSGRWILVRHGLDGSAYRPVLLGGQPTPVRWYRNDLNASWAPTLDALLFHSETQNAENRLYRTTATGGAAALIVPPAGSSDAHPVLDATGTWLYFSRGSSQLMGLYRSRPDGSGVERLTPEPPDWYWEDRHPAPSPDGRRVAYETNRLDAAVGPFATYLRLIDVSTRVVTPLRIVGAWPKWSPDGEWLAFVGDRVVRVVRPDGSGLRTISVGNRQYEIGVSWSPDGRWVAASRLSTGQVELINVQSGITLPLAFTTGTFEPVWIR